MAHTHSHAADPESPRMGLAILLTLAFVVGEGIAGYLSHSLALMSDAGWQWSRKPGPPEAPMVK